mgnify:CR=1 FL=1
MSKFKVGDKVAPRGKPYLLFGQVLCESFEGWYNIKTRDGDWRIMPEDELVLYDGTDMNLDEVYDMLKPKMDNILHWNSVESIKNDPFPPQIFEWVGNNINVRYQQYCNECDIKQAIAIAYRSGYLRAKKGRPFKIGGEKE